MTRIAHTGSRSFFFGAALCLAVFLLVPLVPCPASAGLCEEGYPLPDLGTDQIRGAGRIDAVSIQEGWIVLDDRQFRLSSSTEYYRSRMGHGSIDQFHEGRSVGYITTPENEILKIWLHD